MKFVIFMNAVVLIVHCDCQYYSWTNYFMRSAKISCLI